MVICKQEPFNGEDVNEIKSLAVLFKKILETKMCHFFALGLLTTSTRGTKSEFFEVNYKKLG